MDKLFKLDAFDPVAFLSLPAFAQETAIAPLTLEESVARALNHNFDLQLQQFSTRNAREEVIGRPLPTLGR